MGRTGTNYIPRPDGGFSAWANQYYEALLGWWVDQGFDPSDLNALSKALDDWNVAYPAHVAAQAAAQGAKQAKDAFRSALEKEVRPVTAFVQSFPATTNAARAAMGISVRDASRTPGLTPTSRPLALVESGRRLTHHLRLVDESTPTRRARPRGVQRAEVFVALTLPGIPAPANPSDYRYIGGVTRGETTLSFESDKGGMQAHYLSRWVSTSGAAGPWSDTTSATVAA